MDSSKGLTISEAAAAIGVSAPTLRSWERRYGFPRPARTRGGHRRYKPEDVDRLRVLASITKRRRAQDAVQILKQLDQRSDI